MVRQVATSASSERCYKNVEPTAAGAAGRIRSAQLTGQGNHMEVARGALVNFHLRSVATDAEHRNDYKHTHLRLLLLLLLPFFFSSSFKEEVCINNRPKRSVSSPDSLSDRPLWGEKSLRLFLLFPFHILLLSVSVLLFFGSRESDAVMTKALDRVRFNCKESRAFLRSPLIRRDPSCCFIIISSLSNFLEVEDGHHASTWTLFFPPSKWRALSARSNRHLISSRRPHSLSHKLSRRKSRYVCIFCPAVASCLPRRYIFARAFFLSFFLPFQQQQKDFVKKFLHRRRRRQFAPLDVPGLFVWLEKRTDARFVGSTRRGAQWPTLCPQHNPYDSLLLLPSASMSFTSTQLP